MKMTLRSQFEGATKPKKINFDMPDEFDEEKRNNMAAQIIRKRWPDIFKSGYELDEPKWS